MAETIKAFAQLAWPLAVVFIAVAYKPELLGFVPSFIRRVLRLELPGGFKVELKPVEEQKKAGELLDQIDKVPGEIKLKELPGLSRTQAISDLERLLHSKIRDIPETDRVDLLIRNFAQARLEANFAFIYTLIFGSQIRGLIELEARRKVQNTEALAFYQDVERQNSAAYAGYGFPGWLSFLRNQALVTQIGDEIHITPLGDDFLLWLRTIKLSIDKPL